LTLSEQNDKIVCKDVDEQEVAEIFACREPSGGERRREEL